MFPETDVKEIYNAAIKAVQPATVLPAYIQQQNHSLVVGGKKYLLKADTKIFVIAIGKAASPMMLVMHQLLGSTVEQSLVITKEGHATEIKNCLTIEADHPIPGKKSVAAAETVLKFLSNTRSNDIILFLISGGASSLVNDVPATLSLSDIYITHKALLLCGADINEINTVRKHLSNLKGGKLIRYCNGALIFSFIISDVSGNDVSIIGSGLTAHDNSTAANAMHVIGKYNLMQKIPAAVVNYLKRAGKDVSKTNDIWLKKVKNIIVADNKLALQKAVMKASDLGYHVTYLNDSMFGNTEEEAINLVEQIKEYGGEKPACFIAGGETTIEVKGNGKGGRNQHFALIMLNELLKQHDAKNPFPVILTAGTDGTDGPTDAAGALIDAGLIDYLKKKNTAIEEFLQNNDSYSFFKDANKLFITGPTQTNVMDIVIALIQ
jgi:glycerate-2-kinase